MPAVLSDEVEAYRWLEQLRWGGAPSRCPHCATEDRCYLLRPVDGRTRATRTGSRSARRVWKCGACRRQFSVLTGTFLQGTRVGLLIWIGVLDDLGSDASLDAAAVVDRYGVAPDTARLMLARLAAARRRLPS